VAHRKDVSTLSSAQLTQLRTLLDQFINKPTNNPVAEHMAAGMDMSLMIHDMGFLTWHQHFIAELETWLANNGGAKFIPVPYWNPATPIPAQLNKNNNNVNMPLVHNALGGNMPNPDTSPSDPIFWPFHAFLVSVFERWRNL